MRTIISRTKSSFETRGILFVEHDAVKLFECKTLELPDLGNQRNISCIREGVYWMIKITRPNGNLAFLLLNVPGRDNIEIHIGNYAAEIKKIKERKIDTEGCILPGMNFTDINKDGFIDVERSTTAMNKLLYLLPEKSKLIII